MTVSKRSVLASCGIAAAAGLLAALAMAPAIAGAGSATALAAGGCSATAHIDTQWGAGAAGGQIVTVTVVNTSAAPATRWTVTGTLGAGQRVVSAWNASVSAAGTALTAANAAYNGALAPGASTTFGMQLSGVAPALALGCANDVPAPTTPGSSTVTPPSGAEVTVTEADNQKTITLVVGQTLRVTLRSDFVPTTLAGASLARFSVSGGYPTGQPLVALYRAVGPGPSDVTTHTDYACLHTSPPCALPTLFWTLRVNVVTVSPGDPAGDLTVTTVDNQRTVGLRTGQILVVSLPSNYRPPTVAPAGVLVLRDVTGGYPTEQPLIARYVAAAPGQADISTITDAACNHAPTPCPSPQVPWRVRVTVTT